MTVDWKKKLIPNLPYLLFVYLFDKLCQAVRLDRKSTRLNSSHPK